MAVTPPLGLRRTVRLQRAVAAGVIAALASGCTTMVAYKAQPPGPEQALTYANGVGTLTSKDSRQELFMHPTYRYQGTDLPTFTIGYANNGDAPVNFTPAHVKAFFRGQPVAVYRYDERIAEIQSDKRGKQVALAILGGIAAGALAYGLSHQTYRSNYSGWSASGHGGGGYRYGGSNTVRVYDPVSGILGGLVVGGATVSGVRQLEYAAINEEQTARLMLQENTVEPRRLVTGDVILKDCCDRFPRADDVIRFEVTVGGLTRSFEFMRTVVSP